jgi:outer membrane immunogenic protein
MRRVALIFIAMSAFSGTAAASDFVWRGGYIGLVAGSQKGNADTTAALAGTWAAEPPALRTEIASRAAAEQEPSGTGFGIKGGYDFQLSDEWIWGVSAEYIKTGADDARQTGPIASTAVPGSSYSFGNSIEVDDSVALRARVGYTFGYSLVYLSAGWQWAGVNANASIVSNTNRDKRGVVSDDLTGVGFGLGWEYAFADNWTVQVEYQRANFGDVEFNTAYAPGSAFAPPASNYVETIKQDLDMSSIRLGINYRF